MSTLDDHFSYIHGPSRGLQHGGGASHQAGKGSTDSKTTPEDLASP